MYGDLTLQRILKGGLKLVDHVEYLTRHLFELEIILPKI